MANWTYTVKKVEKSNGNTVATCFLKRDDGYTETLVVPANDLSQDTLKAYLLKVTTIRDNRDASYSALIPILDQEFSL